MEAKNCSEKDIAEKWVIDLVKYPEADAFPDLNYIVSDVFSANIPESYFSGVFISNFLEHLGNQREVSSLLNKIYESMKRGGRIAIMGPNFKYTFREYFDFADHTVPLTEKSIVEHLVGNNFRIVKVYPKFLPFSFTGKLPVHPILTRLYLSMPIAWKILGKQFLVIAEK